MDIVDQINLDHLKVDGEKPNSYLQEVHRLMLSEVELEIDYLNDQLQQLIKPTQ